MEAKRLAAGTPVEETLDGLQRRLIQAEKGATKLSKHLHKYGFKSSANERKDVAKIGNVDKPSSTLKSSKMRVKDAMQKSFEDMESRVNKMENTIHSLRVGMTGLEEEGVMAKDKYDKEITELRNKYLKEMKTFEEKLEKANIESEELKRRDLEMKNELDHVMKSMRENQEILAEKEVTIEDLEERIERITAQKNEVEVQLQRETTLRRSIEDAHDALLMRIRDMESVVDSERGQVNDLVNNYDSAKQEAVATREAFDSEHELRVQLEGLVSQQEQDIVITKEKLKQFSDEKKNMESELSKMKRDGKSIRQQLELKTVAHDQLKASYNSLMKDNQKLHEALKIAATDNRALIAQHKESVQREKNRVEQQQKVQDKLLDNAKEAVLKELDREKAATRDIEHENTEIKSQLKNQLSLVAEKEKRAKEIEQKYSIENEQLKSLIDSLRKDKELIIVQKNEKIFELQGTIEKIKKENIDYEITMRKVKDETMRLEMALKVNKQELEEIKDKLNMAEKNRLSQKQIESAFGEIVESKHKLAYENGLLQSKVNQMGIDLEGYDRTKTDNERLKRKHQDLSQQYETAVEDLQRLKSDNAKRTAELQRFKNLVEEREGEVKVVAKAREEASREMKRLLEHNESREGKLIAKINSAESRLKMTDDDNKQLAKSFEAVMTSHSKLESTLEDLQIKLGKKDNEIITLMEERTASQRIVSELQSEMENLQKKILSLEDVDSEELLAAKEAKISAEEQTKQFSDKIRRLEKENCSLKSDIEQLKVDIRKKVKQMEEDAKERESREKEMDAKSHRHKEEMETDYKHQMEKLRDQLRSAQKKLSSFDEEDAAMKRKIKKLKDGCFRLKKEVEDYKADNENKSRRISDMAVTIEELKLELESAAYKRAHEDISTRQFEDEIEKEKFIRIETESKYMSLRSKEKELERQLKKASQQSKKANREYKQAETWFQGKVQELEAELDNARHAQYMLEQTNIEQEKLLESRTEDAKSAVRASRLAINKLKSEVAENLWETKGLKQVLQSERDNALRATKKYDKLMESSARKVEELARELDRAHEKARKAR